MHLLLAKTQLEATPCRDSLGKCFFISLVTLIDKYVLVLLLGTELYDSSCLTCCTVPEAAVPAACTGLSACPSRSSGALQEPASLTRFNSCTWDTYQPCTQKSCSCANCVNPSITYRSKSSGELSASGEALTSKEVGLGGMRDTSTGKECAKSSQVLSGLGALYLQDDTFSTENVRFGYGKFKLLFGSTVSKSCVLGQESQFWFSFSNGFLCCLKCPE